MQKWYPELRPGKAPAFLRLLEAIEKDVSSGSLAVGAKLPTQRDLAERLGLSVGTVIKAYAEGQRRSLLVGHVGRGTFVAEQRQSVQSRGRVIDLSLNIPGPSRLPKVLADSRWTFPSDISDYVGYLSQSGVMDHRSQFARLLRDTGFDTGPDNLVVTNGAQHGFSLTLSAICQPGDKVFVEAATYHGMKSYAHFAKLELVGLPMDSEGLVPEAFDRAAASGNARVLFTMPTVQSSTAAIMGAARRQEIVRIARKHDILIIEDDAYGFLDQASIPLASLAPERTFYVNTLSKCLAPGLRLGMLVVPEQYIPRIHQAMRATVWMASPISSMIASEWIENGLAAKVRQSLAQEAKNRVKLASQILRPHVRANHPPSFHVWLDLPSGAVEHVAARALQRGVITTPSSALLVDPSLISGLRVSIGVPDRIEDLEWALRQLAGSLEPTNEADMSII
ncbi:PLP-dependent aminotransferase family protein (plasmid) [Bradyrhizobium sp. 183]|uniref:aminotransferase-like domain-containing protein n=1 Tax=unclassified Bradyrhizobium TaxID=2631580 RepID=UPI001FFB7DC0|nr:MULTISPECIES: PLP-dependent aminotransferase family protein [unclassified Bradyrhizobium]MCK1568599.1 PLP-dependent aminotransferase family protein [Bradyrhizobium sp. 173]UPJ84529.1 PLP-dependent aminotransferase family protein [Bradyrhizobium sp. 184]UPJ92370.1 PLP-dependent aminotransferase family protein [Bradyrhizobium sp. 183]UPK15644.1 PLP-dependent aminotransferase family protein [Bradyrhizobium sp. 155]